MPLSFPSYDHLPLKNPPLKEVVCQVRFPVILKIAQNSPVEVQDAIRDRFPNFRDEHGVAFALPQNPGQSIRPEVTETIYRFQDDTGTYTLSLAPSFFSVSTEQYSGWRAFADNIKLAAETIMPIYQIRSATRIGLRYINVLNTANTKQKTFDDVLDMIRKELVAPLRSTVIQDLDSSFTVLQTKHEDSIMAIRFGIVPEAGNQSFLLDFDQYIEAKTELSVENLLERCDQYHSSIYNAFRWSLNDIKTFEK